MGGVEPFFKFKYFSLLILGLYTDFELHVYTGTARKVCGGGGVGGWWWWVVGGGWWAIEC